MIRDRVALHLFLTLIMFMVYYNVCSKNLENVNPQVRHKPLRAVDWKKKRLDARCFPGIHPCNKIMGPKPLKNLPKAMQSEFGLYNMDVRFYQSGAFTDGTKGTSSVTQIPEQEQK